jgi:ABC-type sugar transport system ATPase subunit
MRGIRKAFGSTEVLHGVDFEILPGEVHVLAGENGAGKSTVVKILSGVYGDFSGTMAVEGKECRFLSPTQASQSGITTIHQELSLVPSMSISDNLFLGQEMAGGLGRVDFRAQEKEAARILEETDLDFSPRHLVEELPIAGQQTLEIARSLARDARVVVFDEPTSALGEKEVDHLFHRIQELRRSGRGIVYITHKMDEIYRIADRISVLRDGEMVGTAPASEMSPVELVRLMVGRELEGKRVDVGTSEGDPPEPILSPTVVLQVEKLRVAHPRIRSRFVVDGVDFTLHRGEILGVAGLEGSGKSEVLHALFGALEGRASGTVLYLGTPWPLRDPSSSVGRGMVLLTNDRKSLGLAPDLSVTHSVSLSSLDSFCGPAGWVREEEEREAVEKVTHDFRLNTPSLEAPVRTLSGGNQQKVYLARCLLPEPRILLLDEPTRGIDVGAKADIYSRMDDWVEKGIGILLITSEMDELLSLSHRIIVMHRGQITQEFTRATATKDGILAAAMGHAFKGENK